MKDILAAHSREIINRLPPAFRAQSRGRLDEILRRDIVDVQGLGDAICSDDLPDELRVFGAWLLGRLDHPDVEQHLLRATKSRLPELRWEACRSLGLAGADMAVPRLIEMLRQDQHEQVRASCAAALGLLEGDEVSRALCSVVQDESETEEVRGCAAEALASLPGDHVVDVLIAALDDASSELRYWAAFALGEIGARKALPKLREMLNSDSGRSSDGEWVREEAGDAIRRILRRAT